MYRNIRIGDYNYLIVTISDRSYVLGKTGRVGDCQDHGRMMR